MIAAAIPLPQVATGQGWRAPLIALACATAGVLLFFAGDADDIVRIWWTSSTFGHCLFVLPLIGWLVWLRRAELARLTPRAWAPGLLLVVAGAFGWLLGEAAGVAVARHFGLLLMLEGCVVTTLGPAVARGLLFPLTYALFLVPWGEGLEPLLQLVTARMAVALLPLTGVPALLDGVFITTPHGWFVVAEACSGVKFLIAMLAYGALVANVAFRSWRRRAAFMGACVVVPILANGIRAWGTIFVAEHTDLQVGGSFDHVVYGWFFFAFVVAVLVGGAWRFFDRPVGDPAFDPARLDDGAVSQFWTQPALTALGCLAVAAAPLMWSATIATRGAVVLPLSVALRVPPGWQPIAGRSRAPWAPAYERPDLLANGRFRDTAGHIVDVTLVAYARQGEGRELVGYGRGVIGAGSVWAWSHDEPPAASGRVQAIAGPGKVAREVASFYRVAGTTTGSDITVKLLTLKARLLGGPQRAAALFVSAEEPGARPAIDAWLRAAGPVDGYIDGLLTTR